MKVVQGLLAGLILVTFVCAQTDRIAILSHSSTVLVGGVFSYEVEYAATGSRELLIQLRNATRRIAGRKVYVNEGTGSVDNSFNLGNLPITPGAEYYFRIDIRLPGGNHRTAFDREQVVLMGTGTSTPAPSAASTPAPTAAPTVAQKAESTPVPTPAPTVAPTAESTPVPTPAPTVAPTAESTPAPTAESTPAPTPEASAAPDSKDACAAPIIRNPDDACPESCYRRVVVAAMLYNSDVSEHPWFVTITRISDGVTFTMQARTSRAYLALQVHLLSGHEYLVEWSSAADFVPKWYSWGYKDDNDAANPPCKGGVTLVTRFDGIRLTKWGLGMHKRAYERPCAGTPANFPSDAPTFYERCRDGRRERVMVLPDGVMSPEYPRYLLAHVTRASDEETMCTYEGFGTCAIVEHEAQWRIDDSGETHANYMDDNFDDEAWPAATAPIGSVRTIYMRKQIVVEDSSCFSRLSGVIHAKYTDGFIAYLNGLEIARVNMPEGPVDANTGATRLGTTEQRFTTVSLDAKSIDLQTGLNTIAVEVHSTGPQSSQATMVDLLFLPLISEICLENAHY